MNTDMSEILVGAGVGGVIAMSLLLVALMTILITKPKILLRNTRGLLSGLLSRMSTVFMVGAGFGAVIVLSGPAWPATVAAIFVTMMVLMAVFGARHMPPHDSDGI